MNLRAHLLLAVLTILPIFAKAQDPKKVNEFTKAVAQAEGFNHKGTIPARYHNPGDLKSRPNYPKLPGQISIGKGGHIVFKNDAAGWAALRNQITKVLDGRSKHFNSNMSIAQVGKVYAGNWRPWVKIVSKRLGVPPTITLAEYFELPPTLEVQPNSDTLSVVMHFPVPLPLSPVELRKMQEKAWDNMELRHAYEDDQDNPQRQNICI